MSSFTDDLIIKDNGDGTYTLMREFDFYIDDMDSSSETIHCPVGLVTDFASIPKIFWSALPPNGRYGKAAVIHDLLYQNHGVWCDTKTGKWFTYSRKQCDNVLLDGMKVLGVNALTQWIIYTAVRIFGGWAWSHEPK